MADEYVSATFKKSEFVCKCGCGLYNMRPEVIVKIQRLRDIYGPLAIISGCRCPKRNAEVGGVKDSPHLNGWAIDVLCVGSINRDRLITAAIICNRTGLGIKPTSIHVDWMPREHNRIWLYPPPKV